MLLAQTQSGGGGYSIFLVMGLLLLVMYFFMIRPQQRRRREVESLQSSMGAGDEVVTIGGLHATVASVDDDTVLLEIAPGVIARYARGAIARVTSSAVHSEETDPDGVAPIIEPTAAEKVVDTD